VSWDPKQHGVPEKNHYKDIDLPDAGAGAAVTPNGAITVVDYERKPDGAGIAGEVISRSAGQAAPMDCVREPAGWNSDDGPA